MPVTPPAPNWADADRPNYMQAYGTRLRAQGYSIIPILPGTKKPGRYDRRDGWVDLIDWQRYLDHPATPWEVSAWSTWPGCGVGVLTGAPRGGWGIVLVDGDILDHEVSAAARMAIEQHLGKTPAVRIGKHPKFGCVYRTDEPFRKIDRKPIEVLGVGQQFLAYATHPDTQQPYSWPLESLVSIPLMSLPAVTESGMREAVDAALEHVPEEMKPIRLATSDGVAVGQSAAGQRGTDEAVASALAVLDNPDLSWDEWNRIGMAAWAATDGSEPGFVAFDDWSQRSAKYDAKETVARWRHYAKSPPTQIGAGTLYELAMRHGWSPPSEIALNPSKVLDVDMSGLLSRGETVAETATPVALPATIEPAQPAPAPTRAKGSAPTLPKVDRDGFPREWIETRSLVGEVTRHILASANRPHETFALFNSLCMLATVYGRRYKSKFLGTRANLMCVVIAGPGSGKDHSRKIVKMLLKAAGLSKLLAGDSFTSGVAIIKVLHEHPSKLSHMDEMGLFLQSLTMKNASPHQRAVIKTMLEVFSSSSSVYNGQEYANSEQERVDIENPNFNLFGSTTPGSLVPAMSRAMADNGLLSRLLLVPPLSDHDYPDPQAPLVEAQPPAELVAKVRTSWEVKPTASGNLANQQSIPESKVDLIDVHWGEGVMEMYQRLEAIVTERGRSGRYVWTRCAELTIKLAMIEAISLDPVNPVIEAPVFDMAWRLVKWCLTFSEQLLSDEVAENETEANHKAVLRSIRSAGSTGIAKSEITKRHQSIKQRERDEILSALIEGGDIKVRIEKSDPKGPGRSKTTYYAT